jgi:hypothetical protein
VCAIGRAAKLRVADVAQDFPGDEHVSTPAIAKTGAVYDALRRALTVLRPPGGGDGSGYLQPLLIARVREFEARAARLRPTPTGFIT